MKKRKSQAQWMEIVKAFKTSGLNLTAWCRENNISKSTIYPYVKKYNEVNTIQPQQRWGVLDIPKSIEKPMILLKIGAATLEINSGFDKELLLEVLSVVKEVC